MKDYIEHLENLNRVLFNIRNELTLDAIKDVVTINDFEEFFNTIGYNWDWNDCYLELEDEDDEEFGDVDVDSIDRLCYLLNKTDNCKEKNELNFYLSQKNNGRDYYNFYITPYIFYKYDGYQRMSNGDIFALDVDYSVKWIKFLIKKHGEQYINVVKQQIKKGLENTNKKHEADIKDLKSIYEIIIKYEELSF